MNKKFFMSYIDRPAHYVEDRKYEPIDVMQDWGLMQYHCLATALKYISRCGRKGDAIEDLKKAVWYLQREISIRET